MKKDFNKLFWNLLGVNHRVYHMEDILLSDNANRDVRRKQYENGKLLPHITANGILYKFLKFICSKRLNHIKQFSPQFYANLLLERLLYYIVSHCDKNDNKETIDELFDIIALCTEVRDNFDTRLFYESLGKMSFSPFIEHLGISSKFGKSLQEQIKTLGNKLKREHSKYVKKVECYFENKHKKYLELEEGGKIYKLKQFYPFLYGREKDLDICNDKDHKKNMEQIKKCKNSFSAEKYEEKIRGWLKGKIPSFNDITMLSLYTNSDKAEAYIYHIQMLSIGILIRLKYEHPEILKSGIGEDFLEKLTKHRRRHRREFKSPEKQRKWDEYFNEFLDDIELYFMTDEERENLRNEIKNAIVETICAKEVYESEEYKEIHKKSMTVYEAVDKIDNEISAKKLVEESFKELSDYRNNKRKEIKNELEEMIVKGQCDEIVSQEQEFEKALKKIQYVEENIFPLFETKEYEEIIKKLDEFLYPAYILIQFIAAFKMNNEKLMNEYFKKLDSRLGGIFTDFYILKADDFKKIAQDANDIRECFKKFFHIQEYSFQN
jgi:hypothetical protein